MIHVITPRLTFAGISGDSGKTIITSGFLSSLKHRNISMSVFKKGPDYIDPAWLELFSGTMVRNLDTYMMGAQACRESFAKHSYDKDIAVIEGNRGLLDGMDAKGTHSTAELAKITSSPVILVITPKKVTRTTAAFVLGCKMMAKGVKIAGVVLNQVSNQRHANTISEAILNETGIPVIGVLPKYKNKEILPSRHLGLITPAEYEQAEETVNNLRTFFDDNLDYRRFLDIANTAKSFSVNIEKEEEKPKKNIKIGYFHDRVFSFYYPENLEAIETEGAELVKLSSVDMPELPKDLNGLYIGGGFPETNLDLLNNNKSMMESIKKASDNGMPIYAECGGLIYLAKSIEMDGKKSPLCGIFDLDLKMYKKPMGHGYSEMKVDKENPFFSKTDIVKGHEFHYTAPDTEILNEKSCLEVLRGSGIAAKRDGFLKNNTFGAYLHLHVGAYSKWAKNFVNAANSYN